MHIAQVQSWSMGLRYVSVDDLPALSENQIQLRVLAAGPHQVIRSPASEAHYSARHLLHTVGVDCVAKNEARKLYYFTLQQGIGTFAEPGWPSLSTPGNNLPEDFTAVIIGATSAGGRLAVYSTKKLGASRVIGIARSTASLENVDGLDDFIVLQDSVTEADFSELDCDVILGYVYGDVAIDNLEQRQANIPSRILGSFSLTIRGAGAGARSISALKELNTLVSKMSG
ncbi:hypothetical protein AAE478_008175 [Parahypoxylon ruwenzoriense]